MNKTAGEHARILVIDDESLNRVLLKSALEQVGYEVATAVDGHDAFQHLQNYSFDLILLDLMLPDIKGEEILTQLQNSTLWKHIPVIIISAEEQPARIERCLEMGAVGFLSKPFDPEIVFRLVQEAL